MELRKVGRRFYQSYKKEDGGYFRGLIGKPPLTGRYTNYSLGGLVLFTAPETNVQKGDIFFSAFGRPMMCLDNADEESVGRTQKCFCLKLLNSKFKWERQKTVINKLTGLPESVGIEDLGLAYGSLEADGQALSVINVPFNKYKFITNKDLEPNDVLDGKYVVVRVDKFLGVTIADVKNT